MSGHKVVGDLTKPIALLLIILAAQGMYVIAPRIPLLFSKLEVSILNPLCKDVYPVYVTLDGHPLTSLEEANFEVSVDGKPVRFKLIRNHVINAMVLLDTSGSMAAPSKIEAGKNMTRFIIDTVVRSGGEVAIITFNGEVRLESNWTGNTETLELAISKLQGSGSTRLWDAIKEATPYLQAIRDSKPCELTLLVVVSDFGDTASITSREEALKALKGVGVFAVAIVYGSFLDVSASPAEDIALATGRIWLRASEAKEAIMQLQAFLGSIYYLEIKDRGHIKITVNYMGRSGSDEIES